MGKKIQLVHKVTTAPLPTPLQDPIYEECDEHSTLGGNPQLKLEAPSPPPKHKKIAREKCARVFNPDDRFLPQHIQSWKNWKPNGIYKKMAAFLSNLDPEVPNKTPNQCKSYDERMKYLHFDTSDPHSQIDLLAASLKNLQDTQLDANAKSVLKDYVARMDSKSQYIDFLQRWGENEEGERHRVSVEAKKEEDCMKEESVEVYFNDQYLSFNEFFDDTARAGVF